MPVIAAVQGLCFGGGLELALRADMIFAGESSTFGHPEQSLGIVTVLGGIYRVAERAGRSRAAEWALTSERVPAATMERFGIVNRVVADADLLKEARAFARRSPAGPRGPMPPTRRCCAPGPWAAWRRRTMPCSTSRCRCSRPMTSQRGLRSAVDALKAGKPRPALDFKGR